MAALMDDRSRARFSSQEQALLERTVRKLKVARLRVPDVDDMDSGDLVDFFNHLVLFHDIPALDSPTWINWDVTSRCNCSCVHCAANAVQDVAGTGLDETSTEQALSLIDEMAEAGVLTVVLSGGEPFMRRDLYTLLQRIKQRRMFVSILTNASVPIDTQQLESILDPDADMIQVSIDGPDAASHDGHRRATVFDAMVANVQKLLETSIPIKANMVLTHQTADGVVDVFHFVRKLGIPIVSFTINCPVGRGENIEGFDPQRLLRISMNLHLLSEQYPDIAIRNNVLLLPYALPQVRELIEPDQEQLFSRVRCLAATAKAVIDSRGDLYPCPFLLYPEFNAGNVFEEGFFPLWTSAKPWAELREGRNLVDTNCGQCGFLNRCRGECPGAAFGIHRTIHAPDPRCDWRPQEGMG